MATYVRPKQQELQERILFLQLTLAALQAQLDNKQQLDNEELPEPAPSTLRTKPGTFLETPLAIAAG